MNDIRLPRAVLISSDSTFIALVRQVLTGPDRPVSLDLELTVPMYQFGEQQIQALRALGPDLIVLDLEESQELGLQLAQYLVDLNPAQLFIATGRALSSEQLMQAMRAGVTDFLPKPVAPEDLHAAVLRVVSKLRRTDSEKRQPGRVFSFFSPKGGGGSTTMATNLAILIHRTTGGKTLLVDLDLELGESALVLGMQPRFNLVDFVENFRRMDAGLLASYIDRHASGVDLLSAPFKPEKATETVTAEQVRRILAFLRQHYDYIVVDTPRSFAPQTLAVFEQADLVFLISTADLASLRNIQRGIPLVKRALTKGEEQVRLILNRYDPKDTISVQDVEQSLGLKVYWKVSNDYEAVMGSVNAGKPIVLNGGSPYTRDLAGLVAQVTGVRQSSRSKGSRLTQVLAAPFRGIMGRKAKRHEGGK